MLLMFRKQILLHIKRYLVQYFANKAISDADKIWDKCSYTNKTMDKWLNEDKGPYGKVIL